MLENHMNKKDLIARPDYISMISPYIDVHVVKVLSGVRRCGKSCILDMIGDELLKRGVRKENIITRLYTSVEVEDGFSKTDMYEELKHIVKGDSRKYLLLDEVQEIEGWEQAVNTLFETSDVDVYVTGSNSRLTPENLSTYLSGRYVLIPVYPLSFREYLTFAGNGEDDIDSLFLRYVRQGGFPLIAVSGLDDQQTYQVADGIYQSIINRDILSRHPVREPEKFNRVVRFIIDHMGQVFSANSISAYLKSQGRQISVESVYNYITWLKEAFILYECNRFDLIGKESLKTQEKYYLSDISFRYSVFGYKREMLDAVYENIVYLEMRRRGYDVHVGKLGTSEIDFMAKRKDEELYVQVCVRLPRDSSREIGNLMEITNHHPKYVVSGDRTDVENVNGIRVVYITDFLLAEKW